MNQEQREEIVRRLQLGEELSPEWVRILFPPQKREYELVYHGKEREEDIIASTLAVPLQKIRTFGKNGDGWHNKLIFGDNLQVMKTLLKLKEDGELVNPDGSHGVRLIYIDPPFATKRDFQGGGDQRAYQDKVIGAQFLEFVRKRLVLLRELLSPTGSIYLHLDQRKGHYIKVIMDEVFGEHRARNSIARIKCSPKNYTSRSFGNIHDMLFFYSMDANSKVNELYLERILTEVLEDFPYYDEKAGKRYKTAPLHATGIRKGETGRAWRGIKPPPGNHWRYVHATLDALDKAKLVEWSDNGNPRKKIYADDSEGYAVQDICDFKDPGDRLASYPTEKSEHLLAHVIRASSNPGDIVLDAFAGSGTTLAVAEKLERKWIGIDCGKFSIYTIQKRLLNLRTGIGNNGAVLKPKAFSLYNAGLYDFSKLKELSWDAWRFFALQLFQCHDAPHKIGGILLDGHLRGSSVLVFNHQRQPG
ncbi:MAG: site-specific DNA-methyltransferase, partial [Nevskia sp.]|nr:site-specific DNA-methyltransferase [Nevskia sp.]